MNSSFKWPIRLLTGRRYRAMRALYAFCKVADNIADSQHSEARKLTALTSLERRVRSGELSPRLTLALLHYQIPPKLLLDLLEGMRWDITGRTRSLSAEDLERYCYLVAGTVGLMSIRIMGCQNTDCERFALELGQILQRINILRDVREDGMRGRCYLPNDWRDPKEALDADIERRIQALRVPEGEAKRLRPALAMLGIYEELWLQLRRSRLTRRRLSLWRKIKGMLRAFSLPQRGE